MKIRCKRKPLAEAFAAVSPLAGKNKNRAILANVLVQAHGDRLMLTTTDLETFIRVTVWDSVVAGEGACVLPAARFSSWLADASEEFIKIDSDAKGIVVSDDNGQIKFPVESPDDFPKMHNVESPESIVVGAALLREMIRRTVPATTTTEPNNAYQGIRFEFDGKELTAVASDKRRCHWMSGPATGNKIEPLSCIPATAMSLVARSISDGDVAIAVSANDACFIAKGVEIRTRFLEGKFPRHWKSAVPSFKSKWPVPAGPLSASVRRASVNTDSELNCGVTFKAEGGKLATSGRSQFGESGASLLIGDCIPVAFTLNPRFVLDGLRCLDGESSVDVAAIDSKSPVLFSADDGYQFLVMPLHMEE